MAEISPKEEMKVLGKIVDHLRNYPFLLVSIAGLIIFSIALKFDNETLKEFKYLIYAIILGPICIQAFFEFLSQKQQFQEMVPATVTPHPSSEEIISDEVPNQPTPSPLQNNATSFNWKAFIGLIFVLLALYAIDQAEMTIVYPTTVNPYYNPYYNPGFGGNYNMPIVQGDDETYIGLAFLALVFGGLGWQDARKNKAKGKSLAIFDVVFALMILFANL